MADGGMPAAPTRRCCKGVVGPMARTQVGQCFRFPPDLHQRLTAAADERGVSMNWLVGKLLDEALDRLLPVGEFSLTRPDKYGGTAPS